MTNTLLVPDRRIAMPCRRCGRIRRHPVSHPPRVRPYWMSPLAAMNMAELGKAQTRSDGKVVTRADGKAYASEDCCCGAICDGTCDSISEFTVTLSSVVSGPTNCCRAGFSQSINFDPNTTYTLPFDLTFSGNLPGNPTCLFSALIPRITQWSIAGCTGTPSDSGSPGIIAVWWTGTQWRIRMGYVSGSLFATDQIFEGTITGDICDNPIVWTNSLTACGGVSSVKGRDGTATAVPTYV